MDDTRQVVSRRLRELRAVAGITQEELARAAGGMSLSYVGSLERGTIGVGVDTLERLSRALGCEVADFFLSAERAVLERAAKKASEGRRPKGPAESLGRLVTMLARGADEDSIAKFETVARLWFSRSRSRKRAPKKK